MKPIDAAWDLLKYFKNPHDEEASYGGVSMREHPLFGMPGYEGTGRDELNPRERALQGDDVSDDIIFEDPNMERYTQTRPTTPPNIFMGKRGTMNPDITNPQVARMLEELLASQRGYVSETVEDDESKLEDMGRVPNNDVGRPQTIPMSPRGSKRGKGEQQAFDKPKKPEWWRTLTGEE